MLQREIKNVLQTYLEIDININNAFKDGEKKVCGNVRKLGRKHEGIPK